MYYTSSDYRATLKFGIIVSGYYSIRSGLVNDSVLSLSAFLTPYIKKAK